MNFLQKLESHTGGLLRLKSELFWYGGRGGDGIPDRVCLLLDAAAHPVVAPPPWPAVEPTAHTAHTALSRAHPQYDAVALLLIDGRPQWIWVGKEDVELIT